MVDHLYEVLSAYVHAGGRVARAYPRHGGRHCRRAWLHYPASGSAGDEVGRACGDSLSSAGLGC